MANYTAADVKKLRDLTGAGMMDCKKALDESDGDFDQAVEFLRIKGAKDVGKRAGRTAANGIVAHSGKALLELNCETDFVAKTADFGEKIVLNRFAVLDGTVAVYLHRKAQDLPPQVGVLVEFTGKTDEAGADDARAVGMQIAAMRPKFLTREQVPAETVESERRIAEQTAREEGKPEQALSRIVEGRVNSFFKDFVLLEQASVTDNKKTVKQVTADSGIEVTRFVRFEVGQE
jgi:elongation factor Ts